MKIGNLLGKSKLALMDDAEVASWEAANPLDQDLVYNTSSKSLLYYDGTAGAAVDVGGPVTTWKIDATAPASGSYVTYPETINKVILLFMLNGVPYRVMTGTASATNQVYHNIDTGTFELYIGATPAVEFNSEWLSIIYNNDYPAV